jgi:hypothetical protein
LGIEPTTHEDHSLAASNHSETTIMRLVLEVEASKHAYGVEPSSLGGLGPGATNKGTMLLPSVIAVYSTRDQMLRKRHKGHKQKGYVELLLSVSTGVCPKYLSQVCHCYFF